MGRCVFDGCLFGNTPGALLHRFPVDSTSRKKWLKAVGRTGFQPLKSSRVCCDHFSYDSYIPGSNRLRHGAVPKERKPIHASSKIVTRPPSNSNKPERLTSVNDCQIDGDEEPTDGKGVDDSSNVNEGTTHKHVRLYTESLLESDSENEPPENSYRNLVITKESIMPADFSSLLANAYPKKKLQNSNEESPVQILPVPTIEDVLRRKLSMCRLKLRRRDETIERFNSQIASRKRILQAGKKSTYSEMSAL